LKVLKKLNSLKLAVFKHRCVLNAFSILSTQNQKCQPKTPTEIYNRILARLPFGKIDGETYLTGFFMTLLSGSNTLLYWSLQMCKLVDGLTLSEQGLERKLSFRYELFAK
jgi:hypothetical protein